MASMSSGVRRRTSRYISSRQVQKSSVGWPRNSARPAMARWNACEWTLAMPGRRGPAARGADPGAALATTPVINPALAQSTRTSRAHPEGSSASEAKRAAMKFSMIPAMARLLLMNARIATMRGGRYSIIEDGALRAEDGRIAWIGAAADVRPRRHPGEEVIDVKGAVVTPGLVDCHTHLIYAGDRAREFEMRLDGMTYAEIAKAGGGIVSTVKATRAAANAELRAVTARRLEALM